MIKLLIADDHEMIRKGLALVLDGEEGFEIISEASNGVEACERCFDLDPDVVLMDIRMPKKDGIEAAKDIKRLRPDQKIIMFTAVDDKKDMARALETDVEGYLLKSAAGSELAHAIRAVNSSRKYIQPSLVFKVQETLSGLKSSSKLKLTDKQKEVLNAMMEGYTKNKDIAAKLFLGEETVKTHIRDILKQLRAKDRAHAIIIALRENLVSLDEGDL